MGKGSWVQRSRIPKLGKDLWLLPSDVLSAHIHIRDHRGAGPGQAAEQAGVKVVGGGHSPSDIACTDGFLIHMGKMNRVLQVDTEKKQVTMEAGIHLSDLHPQLDKHGLALSNLGAMSDVTAGGVIGTGTHNTGIKHSILATQVVALTLLTADGTILECSESSNAEVLQAVRVRLGCLGVILTITLQCVPQFHLQETSFPSTLREVLDNLDSHLKKSEYFCFLWSPHTENVSFIYQDHTNMEATLSHSPQSPYPFSYTAADACRHPGASWFGDYAIGFHLLEFLLWIRPYGKDVSRLDYWLAYQTIMKKVGGRPHWAKFCAIREKLDPTGMFLNAYLEVFY